MHAHFIASSKPASGFLREADQGGRLHGHTMSVGVFGRKLLKSFLKILKMRKRNITNNTVV